MKREVLQASDSRSTILTAGEWIEDVSEDYIRSPEFKRLIRDLRDTMEEYNGVGIAAPQIGVGKKIAIVSSNFIFPGNEELKVLINASYVPDGINYWTEDEGCLSIKEGNQFFKVRRPLNCIVSNDVVAQDGSLVRQEFQVTGYLSRILQHEIDHLHGILIDKTESKLRR